MKNNDKIDEKDAFWDIESLIPKSARNMRAPKSTRSGIEATEIVIEARDDTARSSREQTKFSSSRQVYGVEESPRIPDDEYSPEGSLIHRVRIYNWKTSYNYYEQFLEHARKIRRVRGKECTHVPYFSYVPQYSQLSRSQLDWYLWWRECAVKGKYLPTDYSYILLFIYEIINTGGHSNPLWGQNQLCGLWCAYREEYPRLDRLLGEWICDFSLIYHLPAPVKKLSKMKSDYTHSCVLKEFYMRIPEEAEEDAASGEYCEYCNILLTYCSNYDYKRSKFAKGDAAALYDKHIPGALSYALKKLSKESGSILSFDALEDSHIARDAYAGALCSYEAKKRIEIDYGAFSRSYELRFTVSDIVKYSENKIRGYIGVKSKLSVPNISKAVKDCIDEYFAAALPKKVYDPDTRNSVIEEEYYRLYDAPVSAVSADRAAEIEAESWQTTERLIAAFGEESDVEEDIVEVEEPIVEVVEEKAAEEVSEGRFAEALGELFEFVRLAELGDGAGQRRFAEERGEMMDYIADRINEVAVEIIGDVILEDQGSYYSFIEDYRKEVFE